MLENRDLIFNTPIKLKNDLGTITQITLKRIIDEDINIERLISPFLLDRGLETEDISIFDVILVNNLAKKTRLYDALVDSLSILYRTEKENIELNISTASIVIDKKYVLDRNNFIYLCDCVMQMFKIDFGSVQREYDKRRKDNEHKKEMSDIEQEIERRRIEYEKKQEQLKKEKHIVDKAKTNIFDKANYVIHTAKIPYNEVLNYSIYQIENSYSLYRKQEKYEQDRNYFTSGNFKLEDTKLTHWFFD